MPNENKAGIQNAECSAQVLKWVGAGMPKIQSQSSIAQHLLCTWGPMHLPVNPTNTWCTFNRVAACSSTARSTRKYFTRNLFSFKLHLQL